MRKSSPVIRCLAAIPLLVWLLSGRPAGAAGTEKEALRNQALLVLRNTLQKETGFLKVHAAETLLVNDYPEGVREVFLKEEPGAGPEYRIGVWRVLAKADRPDKAARRRYLAKIRTAFLDVRGPDRLHAVETLAKLGDTERPAELLNMAQNGPPVFQVYSRWALANSGRGSDQAALAGFLGSPEAGLRETAAYAFFKLDRVNNSSLAALEKALAAEPAASNCREQILGALYAHSPGERRRSLKPELLKYAENGSTGQKITAAEILACDAAETDLPLLAGLLKSENPDLRVFSAGAILKITRRIYLFNP